MKTTNLLKAWTASLVLYAGGLQGAVDQQFAGPFDGGDLCCEIVANSTPIGQSFVPTQPHLTGVSVHLMNGAAMPRIVQIVLRQGSIHGPVIKVLGTGQLAPAPFRNWVHLDSFCPVQVIPGATYTLQVLELGGNADVRWSLRALGNPYPAGAAYRNGLPVPWDYGFQTRAMPRTTAAQVLLADVDYPLVVARGELFNVTMVYDLMRLNPADAFASVFATANVDDMASTTKTLCREQGGVLKRVTVQMRLPADFAVGAHTLRLRVGANGFGSVAATRPITVH